MNEKAKIRMNHAMHWMMLSCDKATFFITKRDYQKLSCKENLQLNMHLMGCKLCRAFNKQNAIITKKLNALKNNPPEIKLPESRRVEIQKNLEKNF
jgi:hypothetical protein